MKKTDEKSGVVPTEFGKPGQTLLILEGDNKMFQKWIVKESKYYKGEQAFIKADELKTLDAGKYADKNKYPYVFSWSTTGNVSVTGNTGDASTSYSFFIYDRLQSKKWPVATTRASFAKLMKAFFMNLETKRQSNSK